MAQSTKFVDVTRTYLPVDPNSFPETLHGATKEDSPENRMPVMAYKGYNFLPTSYGYKSYFGITSELGISALAGRVDYIFNYQNDIFENILIALTEDGVWIKKGEAAGAWTQAVAMQPPINDTIHYDWSYATIGNTLYCYRAGYASYQKIVPSVTTGVTVSSVVPNFLNMGAQVGVFRAAGRLAFWDTAGSTGWANMDDFADFTPSLETLAGNVKFADIHGRIVTIQAHGPGFIIYCTKSIIFVAQNTDNLFQWSPTVILPNAGISYPRQVAIGSPDTLHFAFTTEGMKKIEKASQETLVPEVTDFLKTYAHPVYLKILNGRYLFLEMLDDTYITGAIQGTDEVIPPVTYTFPGSNVFAAAGDPLDAGASSCVTIAGIDSGTGNQPVDKPADQKPGTSMTPIWTCYLSNNGVKDVSNITWSGNPCGTVDPNGVEANMCPSGLKTTMMTQDTTNKTATTGAQAYVDGNWTMERFVQAQTAIWKMEEDALKAYVQAITNRSKTASKTTNSGTDLTAPVVRGECGIGRFPTKFSSPEFGYSPCAFWLTRRAVGAVDLIRVKANTIVGAVSPEEFSLWRWEAISSQSAYVFASAAAAMANGDVAFAANNPAGSSPFVLGDVLQSSPQGAPLKYKCVPSGGINAGIWSGNETVSRTLTKAQDWANTETMNAYNEGVDVEGSLAVESPFCEITGWKYTKINGTAGTTGAAACVAPTTYPRGVAGTKPGGMKLSVSTKDGSYCGKPFIAPVVDGVTINWPSQTVTLPPSSFFMQKGSIGPVYPTFAGALVYDLQLKKWGKMRVRYKQLLDYSPINSTVDSNVPVLSFGIMAGCLGADGKLSLFDEQPTDSYISYGKVGYYRSGNTSPEEVTVHFRAPCTGYVKVETSLHGKNLSAGFVATQVYTNADRVTLYGAYPGRWSNIEINGIYDISYLEYRGTISGRR